MSVDSRPKYQQLCEQLIARIESGEWPPNSKLPSEPLIAKESGVAYMTVRQAVSALVESGHLRRIRGIGTFVTGAEESVGEPTLGLFLPPNWHALDPFYFPDLVRGFVEEGRKLGFQVQITDRTGPILELIKQKDSSVKAVACILIDTSDAQELDALVDAGIPLVAINHYAGSRKVPVVAPDNRRGAYEGTRRLIELGHRRLVFLSGPESNVDAVERVRGFRQALRDAGIAARANLVLPGDFDEASGYSRTFEAMSRTPRPTAILAASDLSAIGAIRALHELKIVVPEDVSVVGFGDFRPGAFLVPSLSTIKLPLFELGTQAAKLLIDNLRGYRPTELLLRCPIAFRESVGPAPK